MYALRGPSGLASLPFWLMLPLTRCWLDIEVLPSRLGTEAVLSLRLGGLSGILVVCLPGLFLPWGAVRVLEQLHSLGAA